MYLTFEKQLFTIEITDEGGIYMKYKYLITDFHTNIHHEQMNQLEEWYEQAKEMLDFLAYSILSVLFEKG